MPKAKGKEAHKGTYHIDLAMGKGDQVHRAKNNDKPDGNEGVDATLGKAIDKLRKN
jgi:hypothetical protein